MDEAAFKVAWAYVQRDQALAMAQLDQVDAGLTLLTHDLEALNISIGKMYEAGIATPTPPTPPAVVWPPPPVTVTATTGTTFSQSGGIGDTRYQYTRALAAGNCCLTVTASIFGMNNVYIDCMMKAQALFASARVNVKFVKVLNVPGGVGTYNCHEWYARQGLWDHVELGDAPVYSGGGQSSYDWHLYGNNVPGNIDVEGSSLVSFSSRPARIGGTVNCPINRFQVDGFVKEQGGTVYLGGVDGGQHRLVQVDDARIVNMRVQGRYDPGCYMKGTYKGTIEDFSGGTLDLSGMRKVAA